MSCTNDCCTAETEIRDAREDEWVQIVPESARPATLTGERLVKAPGQDGDLVLPRRTPVEIGWPNSGNRVLRYLDEDGYQEIDRAVGDGYPIPWDDAHIVRVLTEEPAQGPALSRQIKPEDVRVGMVVERRKGDEALRDRAQRINDVCIDGTVACLWNPGHADGGWSLWLIEDAPAPVGLDAELVQRMAEAMWRIEEIMKPDGLAALRALRDTHNVTPRAEL